MKKIYKYTDLKNGDLFDSSLRRDGGVVVLPSAASDSTAELEMPSTIDGASYSTGHYLKGHHVGSTGEEYDENSVCIQIEGVKGARLLVLAGTLAKQLKQSTMLVKDLHLNRVFYGQQRMEISNAA